MTHRSTASIGKTREEESKFWCLVTYDKDLEEEQKEIEEIWRIKRMMQRDEELEI
jgi:hypothetical protein